MTRNEIIFKFFLLLVCVFCVNNLAFGKESAETNASQGLAERAWAAFAEGRFDEANKLADQAMDEDPNPAFAYAVKGFYFLKKRDYNKAEEFFMRADGIIDKYYEDIIQKNNYERQKETRLESNNTRTKYKILYSWARYIKLTNDPWLDSDVWNDDNKNDLRNHIRELLPPVTAFDHFVKGLSNIMLDRNAEPDFLKAVQLNPRFAVAYHQLARISAINKNHNQAAVYSRKAIEINPNYSDAYNELGKSFASVGNNDAALDNYSKAIQIDPENEIAYNNRGKVYFDIKKPDLALADYNKAIEIHPRFSNAFNNRGLVYYYEKKQKELALADFRQAVELNRKNGIAHYNLAVYYIDNAKTDNDFYSAMTHFESAIKFDPSPSAYLQLGYAYNRNNKFDQSLPVLQKAVELLPNNPDVYFQRAFANRELGNFQTAIEDYSKSIQLSPKFAGAYFNRGLSYFEDVQKFDLAIADFSKVIEMQPQNWDAYFYRANIHESMGNQSLADADRKKLKDLKNIALKDPNRIMRTLYPNAIFDPVLAKNALSEGTSTITGQACAYSGSKFNARGAKIFLYPVTPYFEAWHKLREKQEDKLTAVYLSREAARYRLETQANEEGRFVFKNLKPGRYFIQTIFKFSYRQTERIYSGSDTTYNGGIPTTTNYYYDQDYIVDRNARLEKFVEIKSDGEIVDTEVAKGGGILRRGC